jgi:hypothetical protein
MRAAAPVLILLTALLGAGCVTLHGPEEIRRELSDEVGVKLDHEFSISVNRGGMWLARTGMKWAGEDEVDLRGVHHVDVGIYNVEGLRKGFEAPRAIHPDFFKGWEALARVQEEGENVLVLTKEKRGGIRGLLVIVAESDEWVIVKIKGDLDQVIEQALAQAFDEIERPELYDKTREERGLEPLDDDSETTDEPEAGPDHVEEIAAEAI